jgi:hypothetical protein
MKSMTNIHFDEPMTRVAIETAYKEHRSGGCNAPMLIFEPIEPDKSGASAKWKATVDARHTADIPTEELKKLLRVSLHCRTDR